MEAKKEKKREKKQKGHAGDKVDYHNHGPLIAFINGKSGGQVGAKVLKKLSSLLGDDHVFDLAQGGPEPGLRKYEGQKNLRVLACGGDGTVGWILGVLDRLNWDTWPPIAVLPLGTGNDMSRVLLWGPGYGGEDLADVLRDVCFQSKTILLDRWKVVAEPLTPEEVEEEVKIYEAAIGVADEEEEEEEDEDCEHNDDEKKKRRGKKKEKSKKKGTTPRPKDKHEKEKEKEKVKEKEKGKAKMVEKEHEGERAKASGDKEETKVEAMKEKMDEKRTEMKKDVSEKDKGGAEVEETVEAAKIETAVVNTAAVEVPGNVEVTNTDQTEETEMSEEKKETDFSEKEGMPTMAPVGGGIDIEDDILYTFADALVSDLEKSLQGARRQSLAEGDGDFASTEKAMERVSGSYEAFSRQANTNLTSVEDGEEEDKENVNLALKALDECMTELVDAFESEADPEALEAQIFESRQIIQDVIDLLVLLKSRIVPDIDPPLSPMTPASRKEVVMSNYLGIGIDSKVLLEFHELREKKPGYFKSRLVNYGWYGVLGMKGMLSKYTSLDKALTLRIDDVPVRIKKGLVGLVVLNIPSYSAGIDLWGKGQLGAQDVGDKKFEVIGIKSTFHLTQIQGHMATGLQLAQASKIEIICKGEVVAQVDGEPLKLPAARVVISHQNQAPMLLNKAKDKRNKQEAKLTPSVAFSSPRETRENDLEDEKSGEKADETKDVAKEEPECETSAKKAHTEEERVVSDAGCTEDDREGEEGNGVNEVGESTVETPKEDGEKTPEASKEGQGEEKADKSVKSSKEKEKQKQKETGKEKEKVKEKEKGRNSTRKLDSPKQREKGKNSHRGEREKGAHKAGEKAEDKTSKSDTKSSPVREKTKEKHGKEDKGKTSNGQPSSARAGK